MKFRDVEVGDLFRLGGSTFVKIKGQDANCLSTLTVALYHMADGVEVAEWKEDEDEL